MTLVDWPTILTRLSTLFIKFISSLPLFQIVVFSMISNAIDTCLFVEWFIVFICTLIRGKQQWIQRKAQCERCVFLHHTRQRRLWGTVGSWLYVGKIYMFKMRKHNVSLCQLLCFANLAFLWFNHIFQFLPKQEACLIYVKVAMTSRLYKNIM